MYKAVETYREANDESIVIIQIRIFGCLDQSGGGKKWTDCTYNLKVEPKRVPN